MEDVKRTCSSCRVSAELTPRFYIPQKGTLIKATQPFERTAIDFKGPLPTCTRNMYLLVIVDEFSRFPFCYPCPNMYSETVIKCLNDLFTLCSVPTCVHSDNARSFLSREIKDFFMERGIATSHCSVYHPTGSSQVERYNKVFWRYVGLVLKSQNLPIESWESVLPNVLHSLRSLLCTAKNATTQELFFNFHRKSCCGLSSLAWLTLPGPVLMRNFVRKTKHDALVREVNLTEANPCFARIKLDDGREVTVSLKDFAPCPPRSHCSNTLENQLNPINDKDVAE